MNAPWRSSELAHRGRCRLVLVDLQERLLAAMPAAAIVVAEAQFLAEAARLLGIPIAITEQYPHGLGATVAGLQEFATDRPAKLRFSATEALALAPASDATDGRDQLILAGIETHVCILQTSLDAVALGYRVIVAADAVASRRDADHHHALQRLRDSGVTIATAESLVFEWCETAAAAEFKALSTLVKARSAR
jgi:nicotinamidase-related amidase